MKLRSCSYQNNTIWETVYYNNSLEKGIKGEKEMKGKGERDRGRERIKVRVTECIFKTSETTLRNFFFQAIIR